MIECFSDDCLKGIHRFIRICLVRGFSIEASIHLDETVVTYSLFDPTILTDVFIILLDQTRV